MPPAPDRLRVRQSLHEGRLDARDAPAWTRAADGTPMMVCPNGHVGDLGLHTIAEDGAVSPSVDCPWRGCDFHRYVQLEGWEKTDA